MVIEDGNGFSDADSYVDVDYADDYFSARGVTSWATLVTADKETALIKGTDFIDNSFDWYGKRAKQEQSLAFPRIGLVDKDGYELDGIPKGLKDAVCEASLLISQGSELFNTVSENGAVTSEKIGDLSFSYDVNKKVKDETLYDAINLRLRGLFRDKSKNKVKAMNIKRVI